VTEMDAGFQHFTHVRGHNLTPKVVSKISAYRPEGFPGNTLNGRFAISLANNETVIHKAC